MKIFSQVVLGISAVLLLAYPFWGILAPESYAMELQQHYPFGEGATTAQIAVSAAMLWASNGILALSFLLLALFIQHPQSRNLITTGGFLLVLYPFVRTAVEVYSGLNLTSHVEDVPVGVEFSSEKALYIVFGIAMIGLGTAISKLETLSSPESN